MAWIVVSEWKKISFKYEQKSASAREKMIVFVDAWNVKHVNSKQNGK